MQKLLVLLAAQTETAKRRAFSTGGRAGRGAIDGVTKRGKQAALPRDFVPSAPVSVVIIFVLFCRIQCDGHCDAEKGNTGGSENGSQPGQGGLKKEDGGGKRMNFRTLLEQSKNNPN